MLCVGNATSAHTLAAPASPSCHTLALTALSLCAPWRLHRVPGRRGSSVQPPTAAPRHVQAPDVMRSCCGALSLLTTAMGGYLSAFLMVAVTSTTTWLDDLDDPHKARLDLYFYLLAGFMFAATLIFCAVAMTYKYKVVQHRAPLPLIGGQQSHAVRQHPRHAPGAGIPPSCAECTSARNVAPSVPLNHFEPLFRLLISTALFQHCLLLKQRRAPASICTVRSSQPLRCETMKLPEHVRQLTVRTAPVPGRLFVSAPAPSRSRISFPFPCRLL